MKMKIIKTTKELWKKYDMVCVVKNFSKTTIKDYRYYIEKFLKFTNNKILEENINPFIYHLRKKKYATATINLALSSVMFLFEQVCEKKFENRPKKFRIDKKIPLIVSRETVIKLINSTKNIKHKIVIELFYSSGVRLEELINIKRCNIDFDNRTIKIIKGKGRKDRYVIVSGHTLGLIKHYLDIRENQNNKYLFDSGETKHISSRHPQQVLRRLSEKLELGYNVHPHSLRRAFGTHLIEDDVNIEKVQKMLGHSNPNTTQIYTRYANIDLTKIKNPLDKILESASEGLLNTHKCT